MTHFRSIVNTAWLYPRSNIETVLASTAIKFKRSGTVLTFQTISDINDFCYQVFESTTFGGLYAGGLTVGVGCLLTDDHRQFTFCLPDGHIFMVWSEATLLTDQTTLPPGVGGAALPGTQGYMSTYLAAGNVVGPAIWYDAVRVVRTG